jgi:hypothetical protein
MIEQQQDGYYATIMTIVTTTADSTTGDDDEQKLLCAIRVFRIKKQLGMMDISPADKTMQRFTSTILCTLTTSLSQVLHKVLFSCSP